MNANNQVLTAAQAFLEKNAIRGQCVVVAVSGGPDSMAVLRVMQLLSQSLDLKVIAGHLNHKLRGREGDADASFVRAYCRTQAIAFHSESRDIRRLAAESGDNLEATARRVRYDWLAALARQNGATFVATGHNANDQAETVLHHLIRGTSLRGLRGVATRRLLGPQVEVIRPLLSVSREAIIAFLDEESIDFRQDATNADLRLTRSRIRLQLLPSLQENYNPEVVAVLCRLAEQADEMYRWREIMARQILEQAEKPRAGLVIVLDVGHLAGEPRELIREVFHLIWDREHWPSDGMTFDHWERLADLVLGPEAAHDFPGKIHGRRKEKVVQLSVRSS